MKARIVLIAVVLSSAAFAQSNTPQVCQDDMTQDRQPTFNASTLQNQVGIRLTSSNQLQLDTNQTVFNPERIYFPFDQEVTISYVYESAGASHAVGYLYYDDLIARGYIDTRGTLDTSDDVLRDTNGNGIADLHEDIFNLAPPSGTQSRPYIGQTRRCDTSKTFTSGGFTYMRPELAVDGSCSNNFVSGVSLKDARPGSHPTIKVDVVGEFLPSSSSFGYTDNGLYGHIPNLLEPSDPKNGNLGLGHLVFLHADDDTDKSSWNSTTPVPDSSDKFDGIPDYDVSAYDADGIARATNPDVGISAADRTVNVGTIHGNREIVFFIVVWYGSAHDLAYGTVYPCLRKDASGVCTLHLKTSTNVFFSRSDWNLDQDFAGVNPVAVRNIGCGYSASCDRSNPGSSSSACQVSDSSSYNGKKLCGWLDNATLNRLSSSAAYGNLVMPMESAEVDLPPSGAMRHVIVGAPSTDPYKWIFGFEDLPGGGDRDFNDVVVIVNKVNGGEGRSGLLSGDISPDIAEDFTITKIRFTREDDNTRKCGSPAKAPCWTETSPGRCSAGPPPTIDYFVAVDCKLPDGKGGWVTNPTPNWIRVPFKTPVDPDNPETTVELDMLDLGFTGSQLCWSVRMTSPNEDCTPTIDNVDVGYQAVRAGLYSRASPSTIANAIIYGGQETPGSKWGVGWPGTPNSVPAAGIRAYDGKKDFRLRGHLYLKSLYDPEKPDETRVVDRWDAGRVLALALETMDPKSRKLYTMDDKGNRLTIDEEAKDDNANSLLFPDTLCDLPAVAGRIPYDMNNDGRCGTATHPSKTVGGSDSDRHFFREWIEGWEDKHDPKPSGPTGSNVRQKWPIGPINLSTVNLAIPPYLDSAATRLPPAEQDAYRKNFMAPLKDRPVTAFVGTTRGVLHAFNAGAFSMGDDACTEGADYRGYFKPSGSCGNPTVRQYGTGVEQFAYLPRGLLDRYVNSYASFRNVSQEPQPSMDASPTIANVDFGIPNQEPWKLKNDSKTQGAKTVLVSSTGRRSPALYALDITDPSMTEYPRPLWEYPVNNTVLTGAFASSATTVPLPDVTGGRHAPSVGRLAWGDDKGWAAVFASDYVPNGSRAGTLWVMDLKSGTPRSYGSTTFAGVITLDTGFGVGSEPALVDLNSDGTYDLIYVASTSGRVYRINLKDLNPSRGLGSVVNKCVVANAVSAISALGEDDPQYQMIHSNLAVKVERGLTNRVRIFFGTGDNPDDATDGPPDRSKYHWHIMAYEDPDPLASTCDLQDPLWVKHLDPNQAVWGGVVLSEEDVFSTTAVGRAADACNLSQTDSGKLYTVKQDPDDNGDPVPNEGDGSDLGGQGVNTPIIHDRHLFVLTGDGKVRLIGDENWNNPTGSAGGTSTNILIWNPRPDGTLPK